MRRVEIRKSGGRRPPTAVALWMGLLLTTLLGCASGGLPRKGWTHYQVGTVEIYSGANTLRTQQLIEGFQIFRAVVGELVSASSVEPQLPTRVFLFPDQLWYKKHAQVKASGGAFVTDGETFTLAFDAKQAGGVPELLLHEYTHLIVANVGGVRYPTWYNEGLAEYYSTIRVVGSDVQLGRVPSQDVVAAADYAHWIPWDELFAGDIFRTRDDPERLHRAYAQAWTAVHYLQLHSAPDRMLQLESYLAATSGGADPVESFRSSFGLTIQEFNKLLRDHMRGQKLNQVLIPASEFDLDRAQPAGTTMTPGATAAALAGVCWSFGNREYAQQLARSAIAAGEPDPLPAH